MSNLGPILISSAGVLDGVFGGGQVYVQKLVRELSLRGNDVALVTPDPWTGGIKPWNVNWRQWEGITLAGIATDPRACRAGENWTERSAPLLRALEEVFDRLSPRLIHINGMKPALIEIAHSRSISNVTTAHHGGIVCPTGALLYHDNTICNRPMNAGDCVSCYCRQLPGGGRVGKMLGSLPALAYRPMGRALNVLPNPTFLGRTLMYPWLVEQQIAGKRGALSKGQLFIAPSLAIAAALRRNGISDDRMTVIPHGIEPLPHVPLIGLGTRPLRFGYVGQISRAKGLKVLMQAFAQLPAGVAELHIIGQPQRRGEQEYFESAMQTCAGRIDVTHHGRLAGAQVATAMANLDVLVLPTICLEVFGLVVLEAFSVGRPVIASDCGGPVETVRHEIDGLIIPPNDPKALASAMRKLIDDPARLEALARNIRPVRTLAQHVDDLESLYRTLLPIPFEKALAQAVL